VGESTVLPLTEPNCGCCWHEACVTRHATSATAIVLHDDMVVRCGRSDVATFTIAACVLLFAHFCGLFGASLQV
jgi:hypothetical protein